MYIYRLTVACCLIVLNSNVSYIIVGSESLFFFFFQLSNLLTIGLRQGFPFFQQTHVPGDYKLLRRGFWHFIFSYLNFSSCHYAIWDKFSVYSTILLYQFLCICTMSIQQFNQDKRTNFNTWFQIPRIYCVFKVCLNSSFL